MDESFDIVSTDAIRDGTATDAYFLRTESTFERAGRNPSVVAEVTVDQFPIGSYDVLAGVADVAELLEGVPIDVDAIPEGRLFDGGPVLRLTGPYLAFARYETSILGFLSHATGFATRALEVRRAAPSAAMFSFGARHVHPALAAVVERAALLAGFDGFSHVAAGDLLGRTAGGTMPHSLLLCYGPDGRIDAWRAFDAAMDPSVPRIALCDTFGDEIEEVRLAVDALGDALEGVRIDTTASRRGNFRHILREIRWTLDAMGREDVDIVASGGITPADVRSLRDVVDAFGIGGAITNADPADFALDIVAVDGEPVAKRGKLPGVKSVYRTDSGEHLVSLAGSPPPADGEALLEPMLREGRLVDSFDIDLESAIARLAEDVDVVFGE